MTPLRLAVAVAAFTASAGVAAAQGVPWTGKTVVCVKDNGEVEFGLRFDGRYVTFPYRGGLFTKVREDRGGRLRLYDGCNEGWADKADFVLSSDAPAHFARRMVADPKDEDALYLRGLAHDENRDYARAIADFDAYLKLHPDSSTTMIARGNAWGHAQDHDRAIADYDAAIRLNPTAPAVFHNRGCEWRAKRNYGRALRDFDEAIRLGPYRVNGRMGRAVTLMVARRAGCVEGFRGVIDAESPDPELTPFAAIFGHLAARQLGDAEAARRFLADHGGKLDAAWPHPVVRFLRDDLDEPTLLALADDDDKRTEARCFLGLDHALRGRPAEARAHFRWVKDHGNPAFTEYAVALAELDRLDRPAKAAKP